MKPVRKSLVGLSLLAPAAVLAKDDKPNIVFFLVDDMGWVDSSVAYGEEVYPNNLRFHTPNMDRLAREGVILTSAYACPVSTPTRTSLLTGMNAAHTGITNWTSTMRDTPSDATGGAVAMETGQIEENTGDRLIRPEWNINGMSPAPGVAHTQYATPLPQLLKDAGYFTIHVGKAHWASAGTPGASPYNMGFVVNVSGNVAGMPRSYQSEENYGNTPEKWNMLAVQNMTEYYGTGVHLTEALTREALKTLEYPIRHGEPFFLYMAHYATHTPIQPDKRFIQKYLDAGMDKGQARYASMVEGVDKSLGDLLDYLKEMGVEKNTVVVFMTDNGGNSENKQKGGVLHTQNKPLREGKGSCYEGGVRVPLMFRWPGRVAPNTRVNTPVIVEDLFPTLLEVAGVRNPRVVHSCADPLGGFELHDEQRARELGAEIIGDGNEAVKQLPDALEVIVCVRKFHKARIIVVLRFFHHVFQNAALAVERGVEHGAGDAAFLADLVYGHVVVSVALEQGDRGFRDFLFELSGRILHP